MLKGPVYISVYKKSSMDILAGTKNQGILGCYIILSMLFCLCICSCVCVCARMYVCVCMCLCVHVYHMYIGQKLLKFECELAPQAHVLELLVALFQKSVEPPGHRAFQEKVCHCGRTYQFCALVPLPAS